MTSRRAAAADPSTLSIPNYGRGAFYGLAGTVVAAVIWAAYQLFTDGYNMLMPAAAGWFASACVKRGMGRVDATGIALSIYFTALTVLLGEFFFFTGHFFSDTGRISLGGPFAGLVGYYRTNPRTLFFTILFTGLGFVIAVINCRDSEKKKSVKKAVFSKTDATDAKRDETT